MRGLVVLVAACGSGGGFPDAADRDSPGVATFSVAWSLVDANAQPETCDRAGATTVVAMISDQVSYAMYSSSFPCTPASAVSGALTASTYELRFTLIGPTVTLATGGPQTVILAGDHTTEVAPIVFAVSP